MVAAMRRKRASTSSSSSGRLAIQAETRLPVSPRSEVVRVLTGTSTRKSPSVSARIHRCIRRRPPLTIASTTSFTVPPSRRRISFTSSRSEKLTHSTRRCGPISRLIGLVVTRRSPVRKSPSRPAMRVPRSTPPPATSPGSRWSARARHHRGGGSRRRSGSQRSAAVSVPTAVAARCASPARDRGAPPGCPSRRCRRRDNGGS